MDGGKIMEPVTHLNHFSRNIVSLVMHIVQQYDPRSLLRFDRDRLLSSFSCAINGVRTAAGPWQHGPGWSGDDVKIGTEYMQDLSTLPEADLAMLWNSNTPSNAPYGNNVLLEAMTTWAKHKKEWADTLPICVVAEGVLAGNIIGGRPSTRKGCVRPLFKVYLLM